MPRRQKLMTADLRKSIPPIYSNEKVPLDDVIVHAKFFSPYGNGAMTWWVTEFDGEDSLFGFVSLGMGGDEWGYFSLSELETTDVPGFRGLQAIERDISWKPTRWGDVKKTLAA